MTRPSNELVTVFSSQGRLPAEVVRGRLEAEQIPAMLVYEAVGQVFGLTVNGLGKVEVKVPAAFAEQARDILGDSTDA